MTLTAEWNRRIENWRKELPRHFYRPLGVLDMSGFVTREHLTPEVALEGSFQPMPIGRRWGAKWEYGWFKTELTLPAEAAGKRIVTRLNVGGESLVCINGQIAGARDQQHGEILLTKSGVPGEKYVILVEAYAGHGPTVDYAGPTPPGRETVPEPGPTQTEVGESTFGVWEEDAYQLWLDVETLYHIRGNIDSNSLRVADIDQALRDFTVIVDFELPHEERLATFRAGRERLKPLLECVNGSTAPTLFTFGHAHLDVVWLWPLAETRRKCARTFSTQLSLMEEYPEFKFLQSMPQLYRFTQEHYPELYARIKQAVQEGKFVPEGGTWVEPDTNMSSGESLIRQFVHGKRFFREEFGVDNELLWLPDVFGYSGALPQIMRGCGIKYFATSKIFWNYNGSAPFPYNTFMWEGIDGSDILVHLCNDYNSPTDAASLIRRWNERVQKDGITTRLVPFGYGDGGGGATRDHLEYLRRMRDLEGVPKTRMASPIEYFKDQEARGTRNRYVGELYFQGHRGTYTSQARTKRGNRKSELALREAELWGVAAGTLAGLEFPTEAIDRAWKIVLLNQFHDILPGSSIHRVYEEAEANYADVLATAQQVAQAATAALTDQSQAMTVFNSLAWERPALVALPDGAVGAVNAEGETLPAQVIDGKAWVEVSTPACGWTTLRLRSGQALLGSGQALRSSSSGTVANTLHVTPTLLENDLLRIEFNATGEITRIWDKEASREWAAGVCNSLKMYKDVPTAWDAWDLDSMYALTPVELDTHATVEVVASDPLVATLRITRKLNQSTMTQDISLRRDSRRVDFHTVLDWQESHKLLKVNFPVDVHANEALHEIQFGYIRRPNHLSRPFDADRFEVCSHKWTAITEENRGFAVLNDCKYGVNVLGNSINLTLLKSALAPDMTADKGRQEFTYAIYPWNGSLAESAVVREAYDLNCPVMAMQGAAGERSLFSVDAPNIIVETVKPAEDGSSDIVVRLYESKRMATRCTLTTSLPVREAIQTDMLENGDKELPCSSGKVELEFRAFEVKTVRWRLQSARSPA
jgi:alpha-mannosidase